MLRLLLVVLALSFAAPAAADGLAPGDAVEAALRLHPSVVTAEAELEQARGAADQVRLLLENPHLSGRLAVDGSRSGATLTQPISLTAEGAAARRATQSRVDAAAHQLNRARLEASAAARGLYVDAVVASALVDVARAGLGLSTRLHGAADRRLEQGAISELDLRLARLAEIDAAGRLLEAQALQARALQRLSAATGRLIVADALLKDPRSAAPRSTKGAAGRSDLEAAEARLEAAEGELARQRAATLAPVGVGAFVGTEHGETFVGPSLQVTLPIFDRNQAARSTASADRAVAQGAATALVARIEAEQLTAGVRTAEAQTLEGLLSSDPQADARAALDSLEAGYRAGELDLPQTLLLQRQVLDGQGAIVQLQASIARARIDEALATEDAALLAAGE